MRVLVTGATGLIGRHLLERLAARHEPIALSRGEPPAELADSAEWVRQDLRRELALERLPERVDAIAHLAQSPHYRDFPGGADDLFAVNVHSTHRLLEYARGVGAAAFVLASTGGNYARAADPIREDAPLTTPGPYFRSKRMAELLVANYGDLIGGAVLRLFFVYGPGQSRMLMARLAESLLEGEEIEIEGDPGMRMNPIHASDAAAAIEAGLELDRLEDVNVAGSEVVSVTDLVNLLAAEIGTEPRIRHSDGSPGDLVADTSKMRSLLRVDPEVPLERGLKSVVGSVREARDLHEPAVE